MEQNSIRHLERNFAFQTYLINVLYIALHGQPKPCYICNACRVPPLAGDSRNCSINILKFTDFKQNCWGFYTVFLNEQVAIEEHVWNSTKGRGSIPLLPVDNHKIPRAVTLDSRKNVNFYYTPRVTLCWSNFKL